MYSETSLVTRSASGGAFARSSARLGFGFVALSVPADESGMASAGFGRSELFGTSFLHCNCVS